MRRRSLDHARDTHIVMFLRMLEYYRDIMFLTTTSANCKPAQGVPLTTRGARRTPRYPERSLLLHCVLFVCSGSRITQCRSAGSQVNLVDCSYLIIKGRVSVRLIPPKANAFDRLLLICLTARYCPTLTLSCKMLITITPFY